MNIQGILGGIALGVLLIWVLVKDIMRARQRCNKNYTYKVLVRYIQYLVGLMVIAYIGAIGVICISALNNYLATQGMADYMWGTLPLALAFISIGLMLFVVERSLKPFWKFTDEEIKYEKELSEKSKKAWEERIEKYPKPIKWFLKH